MGKVIIDCMDFPHPWSLASLNMETKILILNTLCFSIICLYTGTLSPRDKLHKIAPLPLLNTKIILSIINTKLFYCEFFRLCCIFLHNYSIYTIQFGSIPKSCPYSFWRGNFEQNHPQLLAVESQKLLSGHLSETKYSESFN